MPFCLLQPLPGCRETVTEFKSYIPQYYKSSYSWLYNHAIPGLTSQRPPKQSVMLAGSPDTMNPHVPWNSDGTDHKKWKGPNNLSFDCMPKSILSFGHHAKGIPLRVGCSSIWCVISVSFPLSSKGGIFISFGSWGRFIYAIVVESSTHTICLGLPCLDLSRFFFFFFFFKWMRTQNGHNVSFLESASPKKREGKVMKNKTNS